MQVACAEYVDRPGAESFLFLFGCTPRGATSAVVVRGVCPVVEIPVPVDLESDLRRELLASAAKHKIKCVFSEGVLELHCDTLHAARVVESICSNPDGRVAPHLLRALGDPIPTKQRRADPAAYALAKAGLKMGDWITVPPRQPGLPLMTKASQEGTILSKDLHTLRQPPDQWHAPRRLVAFKLTEWSSYAVACDAGSVDRDVFPAPAELCHYIGRVDPDVLVVASRYELELVAKSVSGTARLALSRLRCNAPDAPFAGRTCVQVTAREPDKMLAEVLRTELAQQHWIRAVNRPVTEFPMTELERQARERRFQTEQANAAKRADALRTVVEAMAATPREQCQTWVDPLNGSEHPVMQYRGRRIFWF